MTAGAILTKLDVHSTLYFIGTHVLPHSIDMEAYQLGGNFME
jgi:hypothetical protein